MSKRGKRNANGEGTLFRRRKKVNGKEVEVGNYQFVRRVNGKKEWFNTGTIDYSAAQIERAKILLQLETGKGAASPKRANVTFSQYLDEWLQAKEKRAETRGSLKDSTILKYKNIIAVAQRFLKEKGLTELPVRALTPEHMNDFLSWRVTQTRFTGKSKTPITKKGANRDWRQLRMPIAQAIKEELLPATFFDEVEPHKLVKLRVRLPSMDEIEEVLGFVDEPEARDTLLIMVLEGTRPSELFNLIWDYIDLDDATPQMRIHPLPGEVTTPKTESSIREVPLHKHAVAILRRWRRERPDAKGTDRVFQMPDGRPMAQYVNWLYRRLQRAVKAANREREKQGRTPIPHITNRLLRHFFGSWAINRPVNRMSPLEVAKSMGHCDTKMLQETYYHPDIEGTTGQRMYDAPFFAEERKQHAAGATTPETATSAGEEHATATDNHDAVFDHAATGNLESADLGAAPIESDSYLEYAEVFRQLGMNADADDMEELHRSAMEDRREKERLAAEEARMRAEKAS